MGVRVFADDSWQRIRSGVISGKDFLGLDPEKDRLLIAFLMTHAPQRYRQKAKEIFGMEQMPELPVNVDHPKDPSFSEYCVLKEQAEKENDRPVLVHAAFAHGRDMTAKFAFCRLSGYSWPPDKNDACSWATYECQKSEGLTGEEIVRFCRKMIEEEGPFAKEAGEVLEALPGE